ncbi:hypothetical protein OH768_27080 [Streptomyces sp. NBC_01622]|uniref:hypothetical protein n=1 Tax=Streptomyces sp. NBC_01622 TaxID=2975903 RepID=UPI00386E8407|nr:hypothetical protein OH768_27080 [Streptomyces sp. NBC_01622]
MKVFPRGRRRLALLAPALALVLIPFSTGTASANSSPGWGDDKPDVLAGCNHHGDVRWPRSCQYHEVNAWTALGKRHQASNVVGNCGGTDNGTYAVTYSYATNTSYSYEQGQSIEVSAGLSDTFEAGMSASSSSSETWTLGNTRTATSTITNTIRPGYKGAYWFAPWVRHSVGWIEAHYSKRTNGHYYWYYPGQGSSGIHIDTPVAWADGSLKGELYWATWKC